MPMDRTVHEYHQLLIPEVLSREHHFPLIEVEGRHVTYIAIGTDYFFPITIFSENCIVDKINYLPKQRLLYLFCMQTWQESS